MVVIPDRFDPAAVPELWVLRHGETEWNAEGRLQGWLDSPLTARGRAQAQTQGDILLEAGVPAEHDVVSSPSGRTMATARLAAARLGQTIRPDPDLREVGMGVWQGQTLAEIRAAAPGLDLESDPHLWKFTGTGCESLEEMVARVAASLMRLARPTVLVTHGVTSRVLRCLVLGIDPHNLADVPGGQGVVHHIKHRRARVLSAEN